MPRRAESKQVAGSTANALRRATAARALPLVLVLVLSACDEGPDDGRDLVLPSPTPASPGSTPTASFAPTRTPTARIATATASAPPTASPSATAVPPTASPTPARPTPTRAPAPWQRTEEREPCASYSALRSAFFGDLHVHTRFSADAYIFGTRIGPRDAYGFARGTEVPLADDDERQTRSARIERPLDFTAVTDHAEFFGEVLLCSTPGSPVYDIEMCRLLRQAEAPDERFSVTVSWLFPAGIEDPPASHEFCFTTPGIDCDASAASVWQEMQAAAEEAYDRSDACSFTTFIGYEHTASPLGRHLHRNVIFRNHHVPPTAASQLDTAALGIPQGLWSAVETDCLGAGTGCDALVIPHNSNLSGGLQWLDPADANEAARRRDLEPLVEIHQQKGNSECRFDRLAGLGVGTEDELCDFEQRLRPDEFPGTLPPPIDEYPRRNLVRNTLKDGLALEETLGVNPFKLGFVGSTDTHNATAGNTDEQQWEGGGGNSDSSPERRVGDEVRNNPGGLAVVWAEENSRDAIFAALRRRETYATSGTRPVVRFFAGALDGASCDAADLIERAYADGAPMGGDVGAVRGGAGPRFAVLAFKDPGTAEFPGTDLERVQIVKGWVDATGQTHEKVVDVAGEAGNGAGVDPATCEPVGAGHAELCATWEDPDFDPAERAFYYARVLEEPSCRWSTRACKAVGVDPFSPDCAAQAAAVDERFAACCLGETNDPFLSPLIRERAWTSPIWYRPEAIAAVAASVRFGAAPGGDELDLELRIGRLPAEIASSAEDLVLQVADDDPIFRLALPAGTVAALLAGSSGATEVDVDGLRSISLEIEPGGGAVLRLVTEPLDLSAADPIDHMVRVSLRAGRYESTYTRLWRSDGARLFTGG